MESNLAVTGIDDAETLPRPPRGKMVPILPFAVFHVSAAIHLDEAVVGSTVQRDVAVTDVHHAKAFPRPTRG